MILAILRSTPERQHGGGLGVNATLEHFEVDALNRFESPVGDNFEPAARPLAEWVPSVGDPALKSGTAPIIGAFGEAIGGEEERR